MRPPLLGLGLEPEVLQQVADVLVVASYRLDLPAQVQNIVDGIKAAAAQLHAVMGNFVGWLGYEKDACRRTSGQPPA
ncbi:Virulence effector protein SrfC [Enterobacter cancerogenus]|uniref:Virulence effector protein SrfC n=1 Tax=Enterobacter cancerogenus TaxID=69218 RepID=A0A484ZB89_9ENTR|nr:Virulence effector protein SrfC [Enterobacter cancerogenus]